MLAGLLPHLLLLLWFVLTGAASNNPAFDGLLREGEAALSRRDAQKALTLFSRALELNSGSVLAMQGMAMAQGHLGQHEASALQWSRAAEVQPLSNEVQYNAGFAHLKLGRTDEAAAFFRRCRDFRPALIKLASISRDLGDNDSTVQHLRAALALDPRQPDAYQYMGDTFNNMKLFSDAVTMYTQALLLIESRQREQHAPPPLQEIIPLLTHLGDAEMNAKQPDKALDAYRRALAFAHPSYKIPPAALAQALSGHFFAASEIGRWRGLERDEALLLRLPPGPSGLSPYQMLFLAAAPEAMLAAAASWSRSLVQNERRIVHPPATPPRLPSPAACSASSFTLGYLSRRFHDYPGTQLMLDLFAAHNRSRACVCSFAHGPDDAKGEYRAIVAASSDHFVDISKHTTRAAALDVASAGVEVLVDYDGLHDYNSLALLAHRPAEVHIAWLGFAATTGQGRRRSAHPPPPGHADAIDFLMADKHVVPVEAATASRVSERLLLLPCYQPQSLLPAERGPLDGPADLPARASMRRQLCETHLPAAPLAASLPGALWLCSFNRMGKMTPGLFASTMQIMRARPAAFLLVMAESQEATRELQLSALYHGVQPRRILLFPRLPKDQYKLLLRLSDLFIDTRVYGSHTTYADALIQGLPVLTLPGPCFASRVGLSLASAAGLSAELAVTSDKAWHDASVSMLSGRGGVREGLSGRIAAASRGRCLGNSTHFAVLVERLAAAALEMRRHSPIWSVHHVFLEEARCAQSI